MTAKRFPVHAVHRAELLRHCYRMLGSFAEAEDVVQEVLTSAWNARESYMGAAPVRNWLFRIATNACLNAQRTRRRRALLLRVEAPSVGDRPVGSPHDSELWVTPAPEAALFGTSVLDADRAHEQRQSVALAFVALLQTLPPRQRATLLLKDVVGFSVEDIAVALEMTESAVASALHRARDGLATRPPSDDREPSPAMIERYVRCWETRDLDGLLVLLRADVVLSMPPWTMWVEGHTELRRFLTTDHVTSFWTSGIRVESTRANGQAAMVFYRDNGTRAQSVQLLRFDGAVFTEVIAFIGEPFLHGF